MSKKEVDRRDFLKSGAAGAAALTLSAASAKRVYGANERIGVGFIGTGGRCQIHIGIVNELKKEDKGVAPVAVCDVWDGNKEVELPQNPLGRGLYPSADRCGLNHDDKDHVSKDYRRILDLKEVDVVCIAAPDHWHAKMSIDAAAAGKDVYCEKPMTKTIDEAHAVVDAMKKYNRVMTVGVQSTADPIWKKANEMIRAGDIGHVAQAQTSYYRNSNIGQWRYYHLTKDMTPKTIDWDMFLGHNFSVMDGVPLGPKMVFDRAVYGQWRCYWPFGGGMFTDLFVHQTTHMILAMGVRYPARVVGGGGLYLEYDGRDVPDVSTIVADYDEGCQLIVTATMINDHAIEEVIRGHLATIRFGKYPTGKRSRSGRAIQELGMEILPQQLGQGGPALPHGLAEAKGNVIRGGLGNDDGTKELWEAFLGCVRSRNRETPCTPELGAAAFTTVALGVQSYRTGKGLFWDKEQRKGVEADPSWAARWEHRSKEHGKPNQIMGWHGGETGSAIVPPAYERLAGPWTNGVDPAEGTVSGS